jgi:hypothetical protein
VNPCSQFNVALAPALERDCANLVRLLA